MKPKTRSMLNDGKRNPKALSVFADDTGDDAATRLAKTLTRPSVQAAATIQEFADRKCETELTIDALANELQRQCNIATCGNLQREEAILAAQAHTLDTIFNSLARRALGQDFLVHEETYLRLALKAQSQCRTTVQSLAEIKNPSGVAFVKQANIAHGPQLVNNNLVPAEPSRPRENIDAPSKLLEPNDGERMDTSAASAAGCANQELETVGALNGSEDADR